MHFHRLSDTMYIDFTSCKNVSLDIPFCNQGCVSVEQQLISFIMLLLTFFVALQPRLKAVDIAREEIALPDTMTMEGFEYEEATYNNVVLQYKWLVFLFSFSLPKE